MEYYVNINNEKRGPYTLEELKVRGITAETLIMREGYSQWLAAWQIEELRPLLNEKTIEKPAEEPIREGTPYREEPVSYNPQSQEAYANMPPRFPERKNHNGAIGCLLALIVLALIAGTMVLTCPKYEDHHSKITKLASTAVTQVVARQLGLDNAFVTTGLRMLSGSIVEQVVDVTVDNLLTVDNYVVCSVGKMNFNGEDKVVSVGLFGHVFTVNQETVTDAAEQQYKKVEAQTIDKIGSQVQQNVVDPVKDHIKKQVLDPLKESLKDAMGDIIGDLGDIITGNDDDSDDSQEEQAE